MLADAPSWIVRYTPAVLEWRADQSSEWRDPSLAGRRLVPVCDLAGGFDAWVAAGLPVAR